MNRTQQPHIETINDIELPPAELAHLDNGVPVYLIDAGEQEVEKIELLFKAGKWYEPQNLIADFTMRMLREGTSSKSAKELAEDFDYYGANVQYSAGFEHAAITLYALTNTVNELLPMLHEVVTDAIFPEHELQTVIGNRKQRLKVALEKNDFVANRHFVQALFGSEHPYGRITREDDFAHIHPNVLQNFHRHYYCAANLTVIASGKLNTNLLNHLNQTFGSKTWIGTKAPTNLAYPLKPGTALELHTEKKESVQSAIQIGRHAINKTHPDFQKASVLNTLFGGYFGSRLMANIREDKGYTYGIYSSFVSYPHAGFIEISAEVAKQFREAALREIAREMNRLRTEPVPDKELQMVKNYLAGKIVRGVDGPLKFSETLKGLITYGQSTDYLHSLLRTVKEITAEEIQNLAITYLDYEKMYRVTVG